MGHRTRIFKSGNSLAIRIPKKFHLSDRQEVELIEQNNEWVIRIVPENLAAAFMSLTSFPDDVVAEKIEDSPPQERKF